MAPDADQCAGVLMDAGPVRLRAMLNAHPIPVGMHGRSAASAAAASITLDTSAEFGGASMQHAPCNAED